jgi:primosomal protein N'
MGWFDEDDNDDQEEERKKPLLMSDFGSPSEDLDTAEVTSSELPTAAHEGEDDDPLEAYMKSIVSSEESNAVALPKGSRLDMDNEDEATEHWTSSSNPPHDTQTPSTEETQCNSLAAIFHKASDTEDQYREHRHIDIQLNKTHHATTDYAPFRKQLLTSATSTSQGHDWRQQHSISCHPPLDPIYEFAELREILPLQVLEWIADQEGIAKPTLVQAQLLAVAFSGQDVIATASTGSGKTLAYLLPLIAHLVENYSRNGTNSRALVLVPTRELALQVEKVAKSIVQRIPSLKALAITGGNMGRYQLSQALLHQKPQLIVATPGRLLDVQIKCCNWVSPLKYHRSWMVFGPTGNPS